MNPEFKKEINRFTMGQNDTVLRIYNAKLIFGINQQLQKFQFGNNLQTNQFGTCYVQLLAETIDQEPLKNKLSLLS
ncbi:hypothetical protein Hanom_Chr10g00947181 [Helianthus anomalus]